MPLNEWSHIIGIYDGTTMRIFRNGVRVASSASAVNVPDLSTPFTIGASGIGSDFFHGRVSDVAIYNYAMSPVQLRWHALAAGSLLRPTAVRSQDEQRP